MNFSINPQLAAVGVPPIAEAVSWISGRSFPDAKPLIDLSQAAPGYPPAPALTRHLAEIIAAPQTARYADIEGIPPLRSALASDINRRYGGAVAAEQVLITAGCNQAYCLVANALAKPGDEIILTLPYYFNYRMWLDMTGVKAVLLPHAKNNPASPDLAAAEGLIGPKTRALVLISPNNPTGAIYPPEEIRAAYALCKKRGIALILDETYRDFMPPSPAPHDLFGDRDWSETLIHLYSFSKSFSLPGYRVGALVGDRKLVDEIAKAMDCVAICAPRIGQLAAAYGLQHLDAWRKGITEMMADRLLALQAAFSRNDLGYEMISAGAFFAYLKHPHRGRPAMQVAKRLADEENLLILPGSMFGPDQDDYLRVAFANVEAKWMPEVAERLARDAAKGF
ncbi:MAG TPA: aminotransferase [Candidatus Cybelea sp.]|nr:aminotransferase [Candidatus Cybelea sp.]